MNLLMRRYVVIVGVQSMTQDSCKDRIYNLTILKWREVANLQL